MSYQKPTARDLSEISFAEGVCDSGQFVGTCYADFGLSAGFCTTGQTAGAPCSEGLSAANTCDYGDVGYLNADCTAGGIARGNE